MRGVVTVLSPGGRSGIESLFALIITLFRILPFLPRRGAII